jgi:limonene-1,2-epoxide hydrolase
MGSDAKNEETIRRFCAAFARRDIDELCGFFTPDAVYHNIPMAPAEGIDAIRGSLEMFVPVSPYVEFELVNLASDGAVVFTERIDRMELGGKAVELPVTGVFEVEAGRIKAWRDYFDMQMLLDSQRP